ncbi:hypothetical protein [Nonlabens agnitus]|uniref:hypothetical protein n=1 Tax=Nonlabens agnitus TaxID=870484 RepID=UPI001558BFD1|nr:hypothetical protein [Nonlabens agnitus]
MRKKIENTGAILITLLMMATAAIKYNGWELVGGIFIAICLGTALIGFGSFTSK